MVCNIKKWDNGEAIIFVVFSKRKMISIKDVHTMLLAVPSEMIIIVRNDY